MTVPIVPLPRPTLFNWRQPALNPRPQEAIMQPPVNQELAIAGGSGRQPPTNPNITSVDISGLPPIQSHPILDFSTPSRAPKAASPAWPPSTAERRASMRNRHDTIAQQCRAYKYRRQLANPDTDDEDMEGDQARPVWRRQLRLDIPAYNPLSMQQRLDALRQPLSPTCYPTAAQLASSLPELEHLPYPALTYVPGTPPGPRNISPLPSSPTSSATRDRSPLPCRELHQSEVRPERARSTSPSRQSVSRLRLTRAASEDSVRSQWRMTGNRAASPDQQQFQFQQPSGSGQTTLRPRSARAKTPIVRYGAPVDSGHLTFTRSSSSSTPNPFMSQSSGSDRYNYMLDNIFDASQAPESTPFPPASDALSTTAAPRVMITSSSDSDAPHARTGLRPASAPPPSTPSRPVLAAERLAAPGTPSPVIALPSATPQATRQRRTSSRLPVSKSPKRGGGKAKDK
jgi:hypothetical protein